MIRPLLIVFCLSALWPDAMGQEKDAAKTNSPVPPIASTENSKVEALEGLLFSMRNEQEERNVQRELREYYDLENLWSGAKLIELQDA